VEPDDLRSAIYSRIDELPTLSLVVPRILRVVEDPGVNAASLAELISGDPALAAKMLKVANSTYYGFSRQVDTLRQAVPLLGLNMTRSLAVSIGVMSSLPAEDLRPYFSAQGLWKHSLGVALILEELGRGLPEAGSGEHRFVMGLVHDVGKIVLAHFFEDSFRAVLRSRTEEKRNKLHETEREVLGTDHCEVASMLLGRWRFPERIVGPIRAHHEPETPEGVEARDVALLRVANVLAQELRLGEEGNPDPNPLRPGDLELLELGPGAREELRRRGEGVRDEVDSFFAALHG